MMTKNPDRRTFLAGALGLAGSWWIAPRVPTRSDLRSQTDYASVIDLLKKRLPDTMAQAKIPGLAIALVDRDRLVWAEGFGHTDQAKSVRVTEETLFSLQSTSKTYTALGVLKAVEKGWLRLDDKIRKHLPEFRVNSRFGSDEVNKITIRHLLSHRAGLCHEAPVGNNFDDCHCSFAEHIKSISDSWLVAPVGQRFSYSNLGIDLAGYLVQARAGVSFAEFMNRELFAPMGMTSTTFNQQTAFQHGPVAKGHIDDAEIPFMFIPMIPSGGLYSSVKDMARFLSWQLQPEKQQLLSQSLLKEMTTVQYPVAGQVGGYGLGVYNVASMGAMKLLHSGGGYGYSADQRWIPEYGIGAAVLSNHTLAPALANRALQLMCEVKFGKVPETKAISFTPRSDLTTDVRLLSALAGSYRSDEVMFVLEENKLVYVSGNQRLPLEPLSRSEFFNGSRRFAFDLDRDGRPRGVQVIDPDYASNGAEYWPINERPGDPPGPNRAQWKNLVGVYAGSSYGRPAKTEISIKNGYLHTTSGGGTQLNEYRENLFFTTNGEAVTFHDNQMLLGNRPFTRN